MPWTLVHKKKSLDNESEIKWDYNALMDGLSKGKHRNEFIAALEIEMSNFIENEIEGLLESNTPDAIFQSLDEHVTKVASTFFAAGTKWVDPRLAVLRERRLDLLKQRQLLRQDEVSRRDEQLWIQVTEELKALTDEARKLRRREGKIREDDLIVQLLEAWKKTNA